jgi:hypothetical protein
MTSASTYKESKQEARNKASQAVRRLPIEALLARESKEATPIAKETTPTSNETSTATKEAISIAEQITPDVNTFKLSPDSMHWTSTPRTPKRSFGEISTEDGSQSAEQPTAPVPREVLSRYLRPDGKRSFRPTRFVASISAGTDRDVSCNVTRDIRGLADSVRLEHVIPFNGPGHTQHNDLRPAKRRRFAQVAACALGTVLGGAAVLAGMIVTAPPI